MTKRVTPQPTATARVRATPARGKKRRCAVLLIDAQNSHGPIKQMREVLAKANRLKWPVFEFNYGARPTLPELSKLRTKNWTTQTKSDRSAFEGTELEATLRNQGITDVLIMGHSMIDCVLSTTIDANKLGFKVHVSFDTMYGDDGMKNSEVAGFYRDMASTKVRPFKQLPVFAEDRFERG